MGELNGQCDVHKGFEKLQYIPGKPEVHTHAQICARAQEWPEHVLSAQLSNLKPMWKQEVKAKAKL